MTSTKSTTPTGDATVSSVPDQLLIGGAWVPAGDGATSATSPPAGLDQAGVKAPIGTVSVADAAEAALRDLLFAGALRPGHVLSDTVISAELGIARPTTRVAVQRLVSQGLLEREPGRSARVPTFTARDITDSYRARRLIEFEAVRLISTEHRDTSSIAAALATFEQAGDDWTAGPEADTRFHTAVVAASGSPRLARMFAPLASEIRLIIGLLRSRYATLTELYEEHTALLAALDGGDTETVLRLWAAHIDDAEGFLTQSLADSGGPAVTSR